MRELWGKKTARLRSGLFRSGRLFTAFLTLSAFFFAVSPAVHAEVPRFQAAGTAVSGVSSVNPAWPAHQINDVALLFVESSGGQTISLTTPAGFVEVANSPQATGLGTAGTRIAVYWCRATSSAMATPRVADSGNHVYAQILTFRGVTPGGDPWNITGGGVKASASVSVNVTGITTTVDDTLVVAGVTRDLDSAAAFASAWSNANLTGITEWSDAGTTSGVGGGLAVITAAKTAAGATGNTTATVTSSINAFMKIALMIISSPAITVPLTDVGVTSVTAGWSLIAGATGYTLAASVNPANPPSPIYASSTTLSGDVEAVIYTPALAPNTTYYLFARANGPNNSSPWAAYPGTSTLANIPVFANFTGVGTSVIQFNWSNNGNPLNTTLYRVLTSTAPDPLNPGNAVVTTSNTYNLYLSSSGLNANTTYYFRVAGVNNNAVATGYTAARSTSTWANPPVFANFTGVGSSVIQFNWSNNGNPLNATLYRVLTSTAPDPSNPGGAVVTTSNTYNIYLSSSGLNANTTYYFRVAGINNNGITTSYTSAQSTSTWANMPVFTNFTGVGSSAIQFNWSNNANPLNTTLYRVLTSTAPDPSNPGGAVVTTSNTYNLSLSSSGLTANTTYYFRVAGINNNAVPTSYTSAQSTSTLLAFSPVFTNFTNVGAGAIRFNWSNNGNALNTTLYRVFTSTAPDPLNPGLAVVTSSDTYNLFLSSSGLNGNTTYYFRVAGVNNNGISTSYTAAQSTSTWANIPVFADFTNVGAGAIQFNWSNNANPLNTTLYRVLTSTAPDPANPGGAVVTTSNTYNLSLSSSGLNANTTYYFRVAGVNNNAVLTSYTSAQSTSTLLAFSPVFANFTNVGAAAIRFNWSNNGNALNTTLYRVFTSTAQDPLDPGAAIVTTSDTYNLALSSSGLNANTTYYFRVAGINNNGVPTSYTAAQSTSSLAGIPVFSGFTDIGAGDIRFNWSAGGNPYPGTLYRVLTSTAPDPSNPGGAVVTTSNTYNLALSSSGLNANATYYFRVAGINNNGVATSYTAAQSTSTWANAPVFTNFTNVAAGAIQFNWSNNSNPLNTTLYRVLVSTAPDPLNPGSAVVTTSNTYNLALSSSGLNANTTYYFRVAGVNNNAVLTSYTSAQSTSTWANAPVFTNFTNVGANAIQFNWSNNGNPLNTTLYRVLTSTAPDPSNPGGAVVTTSSTYNLALSSSGLNANTTYYFSVAGVNNNAVLTSYTSAQSTSTRVNVPVFTNFTNVGANIIQFNWSNNGNPLNTTLYRVLTSTAPDPSNPGGAVVTASNTYNLALSSSGLNANTTYYFSVAGLNNNSVPSGYISAQSTSTWANAPVFTNFTNVGANVIQFNWSNNGNPLNITLYRVLTSTAPDPLNPDGAVVTASDTYKMSLSSSGLNANTTYYFRAAGLNNNGILTGYTPAQPISTLAKMPVFTNFTDVSAEAIRFNWSANGNAYPGTRYRVEVSTAPDPLNPDGEVFTTSDTYNLYFTSAGLKANTTYYFRVAGFNNIGIDTGYTEVEGAPTGVNAPVFTNFTNVGANVIQFNWSNNGNPLNTTLYRVVSSTAPDPLNPGGAVVTTSDTYNLGLSSSGLNANTTYYFSVAGINNNGTATSYTPAQSTSTLANAPLFTNFTNVGANVIQFNWSNNGNPPDITLYRVLTSTAPDPSNPVGAVVTASDTYELALSSSGLNANTTYYFSVAGINNNGAATSYTGARSTSTLLAFAPAFVNFTDVDAGAIQFNWSANGNPYPGTLFRVLTSTASDPLNPGGAVVTASDTYNLALISSGLNANASYYFIAAGLNNNGVSTAYTAVRGTSTLAVQPAGLNFTGVWEDRIQFNWSSAGNTPGTVYRVLVSTAPDPSSPDGAVVTASDTYNVYLSSSGLNSDTDYYFRAAAVNNNGILTSYTAPAAARTLPQGGIGAPLIGSITGVYVTSITANWSLVDGATGYTLAASVNSATPPSIDASSTTVGNQSISASVFEPALAANTTYYLFVRANGPGAASVWAAYPGVSTLLAFPPVFTGFTGVGEGAIQFNWSNNGNALNTTLYRVFTSTAQDPLDPGAAIVTTSDTYNLALSSSGLNANTTYYFRVAGINNNGVPTSYTAAQSTSSLAGIPVFSGFTDIGAGDIRFNWSAGGNPYPGTLYRVLTSTAPDPSNPGGAVVTASSTYNVYLTSSGLNANTTYYFRAAGFNNNGIATNYAAAEATSTLLAFAPVFANFSGVDSSAIQFNWSNNGNPLDTTLYRVLVSTAPDPSNPGGAVVTASDTYNLALSSSGLNANTTYYFTAAGLNNNGVPTANTPVQSTSTWANPPVFTEFTNVSADDMQFNWSANGNPYPGTLYRVASSTASDPLNPAGALVVMSETYDVSLILSGLASRTTYYFRAAGLNNNGILTAYSAAQSTATLPAIATKLYFQDTVSSIDPGADDERYLTRTMGAAVATYTKNTLAGTVTPPTAETQFTRVAAGTNVIWYSDPLDAVTIAGNVTFNIWARESAVQANATITAELLRADASGALQSVIASVLIPRAELTTTLAAQNWAKFPVFTVLSNGDRLAVRAYIDDGNGVTMGSGRNVTATLGGATAGVSGDSWVQVTESLAPARPVISAFTNVAARQLTAAWSLVDGATAYTLAASINPDNPPNPVYASSTTENPGATLDTPALDANTTYYLFVRSHDSKASSSWSAYPGTSTLLENAPVFTNFTDVGAGAIQFNWSANGNPYPGTLYRVAVSTAPDPLDPAGAVVTTSNTYNVYFSSAGLNADTTYYFRVAGLNNNSVPTAYTAAQGTATLVAFAPVFANFTNVSANTIQFNWSNNGNPLNTTLYRVLASTAPDPSNPGGAVVTASDTYNLALSSSGLNANATYYFQAAGINKNGIATGYTTAQGTSTWANAPVFTNFTNVAAGAIQFNWSNNGNPPDTTLYRILASTAPDPSNPGGAVVTTSDTYNLALSSSGLSANTTYYFRAAAMNSNSVLTGYTAVQGTSTWANTPVFSNFTNVAAGVIQFNWSNNGNPPDTTLYRVLASTAPDPSSPGGAVVTTSDTYNLALSSSGLSANTTYYFQAAAVNRNSVPSGYTVIQGTATLLANAPVFINFTGLTADAMQLNWSNNGNPLDTTLYRVLASTAPDPSNPGGAVVTASDTYNLALISSGLNANTTYYFRVAGLNRNYVPTSYTAARGTSTLANMPTGRYFTGITPAAIIYNWSATGNASGTRYSVLASTAPDPSAPAGAVVTASVTYNVYLSSSGLAANKAYYFQAAAVNNNGVITSYTSPPDTETTLPIGGIGAPIIGSITGVYVTSMTANWSLVTGATGYTLAASANPANPPSSIDASSTTVGNLSASVFNPALSANATYYLFVRANGPGSVSEWSAYPGTSTLLANAPVFTNFTNVAAGAIQFNWSNNGNPLNTTLYRVLASTALDPSNPGGAVVTTSDTYSLALSSSGLNANTTCYFRVAGLNNNAVPTAYTVAQGTSTWAAVPSFTGFTDISSGSMQANWSPNGNPAATTLYRVLASTAPDPSAPAGAAVTSSDTYNVYLSSAGLDVNATYYFRIAALNRNNILTGYTVAQGTSTLTRPPVFNNFTGVGAGAIQFNWLENGNPLNTTLYRVLASTAPDPSSPAGAVVTASDTYNLALSSSGLNPNTTVYFQVSGLNNNGVPTAYTTVQGTATWANIPLTAVSTFSAASATGFTAAWSGNSNPLPGTTYTVQVSTAQDFNSGAADQVTASTAPASGPAYAFTNLSINTVYYFQVRAVNHNGIYTDYAALGSTRTLTMPAPVIESITGADTNSISASWQLVNEATGYILAASVNPSNPPSPIYASSTTFGKFAVSASVFDPALAPNTTYYLFVRANGNANSSSWSAYPAASTLANLPRSSVSTFSAVADNGFSVSWDNNSNPLGATLYTVQVSTAYDFNVGASDQVTFTTAPASGPGATFSSLNIDTYYYFRVRAQHNNGGFTDWVNLGFVKTKALPVVHSGGDGVIFYGQAGNTMPQFRNYYSAGNNFSAVQNTVSGAAGSLFVIKTNPLSDKQEAVAGYVKDGTLHMLCTDGANWSEEWTQTVGGSELTRRFDIAYETNTGDVMVLYSRDAANTDELGYRIKPGSADCGSGNWSANNNLDPVRTSGVVQWVKMASDRRASSGTIAAIWADDASDLSAMVWNGTAWENEPSAALETSLEVVAVAQDVDDFDVEFESLSGDLMVVWANSAGNNGTNGVRVATAAWTGGTPLHAWGTRYSPPTFDNDATNLDLAANPNSNEMIFASIGNAAGGTSNDMQIGYWSGSAWSNNNDVDATCALPVAGSKLVAAGWLTSGVTTRWLVTYNDASATNIGWYYGTTGAPTLGNPDGTPTPLFANPQVRYDIQQDPVNKDRLIFTVADGASGTGRLFAKRLLMTSVPAFTWSNADGGAALDTSLASTTVGGFSFAFWAAAPSTTFSQSAYRFFNNTDTTDVGVPLAAQDTLAPLPSAGAAFRLRALLHTNQVDLPVDAQDFRLQVAGKGDGTCDAPSGGVPADYTDVTSATVIAFKDNAPADNTALTANAEDPQHGAHTVVNQTYEELNNSTNSVAGIQRNQDGKWDFALKDNGVFPGSVYCLRLVKGDGLLLNSYEVYPELILPALVYVNEVYPSGPSAADDWVELYNNTTSTSPLLGWKLNYVESSIALGGAPITVWTGGAGDVINAGSTFTIVNLPVDLNGGESYHVELLDAGGRLVDQVQWPGPGVLSEGQSFARITDGNPAFLEIDPTPTKNYVNYRATDTFKINEVSYGALNGQFIELYNTSLTSTRTLTGYALRNSYASANGLRFRFTKKIYPRNYALLDFSSVSDDGLSFAYVFGPAGLNGAGDFLTLEDPAGSVEDEVTWQSGASYSRYNYIGETTSVGNYAPAGAVNSIIRQPGEGADTDSNSADFAASAAATLGSRNNNPVPAPANTLAYPLNTGVPQFLARKFPISMTIGSDSSTGTANSIIFGRTGGNPDTRSPHTYRLADIGFNLASLAQQTTVQTGLSFNDQDGYPLAAGATYRVTFNTDTGTKAAPQIILGTVTYDASVHSVTASTSAPLWMNNASRDSAVKLEISNNSPAGFNSLEITTVTFKVLNSVSAPLDTVMAKNLFNAIMLVRDSTSTGIYGRYESGIDVSTIAYIPMSLISLDVNGVSTLTVLAPDLLSASIPAASTRTFYVVFESTQNASARFPDNVFRVSFNSLPTLTVRDGPSDQPEEFTPSAQVETSSITIIAPALPPEGTTWPYAPPTNTVVEAMAGYYTYDGDTSPTVSSAVYMTSTDGYLRAVKKDGTIKWAYPTDTLSPIRTSPMPVVEAGGLYLYFADDNGDVYKIRDNDSSAGLSWKKSIGAPIRSNLMCSDVSCSGDVFYFGAGDNTVRCLNKADGTPCSGWTYASAITAPISGMMAIDNRATVNTAWIGLEDGKMVALKTGDGTSPTSYQTGAAIKSSPYLDARVADPNNVLYFTSTDGKLYARISSNLSNVPAGWPAGATEPEKDYHAGAPIYTSPFVTWEETKYIFFGDDAGRLHKVNAATGLSAAGWPFQAGGAIRSFPNWLPDTVYTPQGGADYVYFGCDDGYIYAVNANTGVLRPGWPVATGGPVRADIVIDTANMTLVVGSTDGKTYVLKIGP